MEAKEQAQRAFEQANLEFLDSNPRYQVQANFIGKRSKNNNGTTKNIAYVFKCTCRMHTTDEQRKKQMETGKKLVDLWVQKFGHIRVWAVYGTAMAAFNIHVNAYAWAGMGNGTYFPLPLGPQAKVQIQGQ